MRVWRIYRDAPVEALGNQCSGFDKALEGGCVYLQKLGQSKQVSGLSLGGQSSERWPDDRHDDACQFHADQLMS